MTDCDSDAERRQQIALFRHQVIGELVHFPEGHKGLYALIEQKAARDYVIPGSQRTRVAAETIRDWLKAYRRGGFDALLPKPRADRGQSRRLPAEVVETLLAIKEANPKLSVQLVIRAARERPEVPEALPLPPSTVHRLLARHGLMEPPKETPVDQDRRRFAFAQAGELWMSDVMHGPSVVVGGRVKRKTYLIAFIDDATRVIPHAAFALSENTRAFLPVLKTAVAKRGLPARLYVDNGANYRSQQLALVCAKLGIALIHARPYRPQGKGKIERWFKTVRAQLLTRLTSEDTASLEALNRRLATWVEGEYHLSPHRALEGLTPLERWAQSAEALRYPEPSLDLADVFLFEAQRKVQKDRTVSLNGVVYEVDALLVGETVTLRFDPEAPPERGVQVCHHGKRIEVARPVQTYANCFVRRERPSSTLHSDTPAAEPAPSALRLRELPDDGEVR
ncbi:DDE-type integrase/transposase/recombinase [Thiorhodovibrio frisius]|uniref:Mu transposase/integrase n=1 Tax=Thiorhodovibrio frisius TaxID=631362 RepID=H8Z6K5_9GAMM|nr:DDE-type integrase/transposase/recombinase [Thiorhodovibrio frisius]EIC19703.1 Mu transposase/integrase [Thiorhodovibrio frisius]WPL20258.1 Integrase core domain protein [Thiorhodovibrio frisius]WPL20329.1 Integrase core domain protein [Thiorhodovibrio frisius]WPL23213.1 Integrase core domain protein [Thiorhodovibrio frisius]